MKKFLILMVLLFSTMMSVSAQTAIENPKFFDNTYVGASVGVTTPMSFDNIFPLNTTVGVKVGKDLSPIFGVNIEGTAWLGSAATDGARFSYKKFIRGLNVGVNGTVNVLNVFHFDNNRVFNIEAVAGLGWLHRFNDGPDFNDLTAKTAVNLSWNVSSRSKLFVEPAIYWSLTDNTSKIKFSSDHAQIGVAVGYVYKFKASNGTHGFKTYDIAAMNAEINALRAENEKLSNAEPVIVTKEVPVETIVTNEVVKLVGNIGVVTFAQGKTDLTDEAKEVLNNVQGKVAIKAYASPEGGKSFNKKLSEKRAEVVKSYLESRGVDVVAAEGLGNTGAASQRMAIVIVAD